ncbi:hypothetical protein F4553_005932 [Allocatelliglobosispora scoriae]|uniref:Uncharacterized protein n=1 Tax=Allocatelliglobosispora scoriae TaxID=643052 RepID=A0A841BYE0_9ACTN|nr:hypothetical protein [Allocatelliglobosispora scoriae]MBB5872498.1 hypothetical protein [Allocatelliglobosispora scoriae]
MAVVRRPPTINRQVVAVAPKQADAEHDNETTVAVPRTPDDAETAASPTPAAHLWAMLLGLGLAAAGLWGGYLITVYNPATAFDAGSEMSIFAGLVVVTAAVERFMEPFTRWMPGRAAQQRYDWALAAMENGVGSTVAAAKAKAERDQARADKGIITWGLATGVSTALAASGGFYLLRMLSATPTTWDGVPAFIDALVTGLVIGSGTKPVHDLISRAQPIPKDEK